MLTVVGLVALGVVALFLDRVFLVVIVHVSSVIPQSIAVGAALLLFAALLVRLFLAFVFA